MCDSGPRELLKGLENVLLKKNLLATSHQPEVIACNHLTQRANYGLANVRLQPLLSFIMFDLMGVII